MTSSRMLRPVLVCAAALTTASCGLIDNPNRFETMAQHVADIPLDSSAAASVRTAAQQGLRPAVSRNLKVEVMDPHELWDARDADLAAAAARINSAGVREAAPTLAQGMVQQAAIRAARPDGLRPAVARTEPQVAPSRAMTTIQLGAYSTPEGARAAWSGVSRGTAKAALRGLSPIFETVQVNGRPFTRLKVSAPSAAAAAICRAAEVSDPWCARRA